MSAAPHASDEWQHRWQELVKSIVPVHSQQGEQQLIDWLAQPGNPMVVAFVNAHAMNEVATSRKFFDSLISADLVLRDGMGMAILLRLLNQPSGLNLNGTDLIPKILRKSAGRHIALFGTEDPYLSRAQEAVVTHVAPRSRCIT